MVVAVDGPAGSGKSTVSREVARTLGWAHLDTGAFYRAATYLVLVNRTDPTDPEAVHRLVAGAEFDQRDGRMFIGVEDVSESIRSPAVDALVSQVAAMPQVRAEMVRHQRRWVDRFHQPVVVEGRDIGTVVFPDAPVKIFLTADPAERARRRALETGEDVAAVEDSLRRRDAIDSSRQTSPLRPAFDATKVDTTGHTVEEVVATIVEIVEAQASSSSA